MLSQDDGMVIAGIEQDGPSDELGIGLNTQVININGNEILDAEDISSALSSTYPYEKIEIETEEGLFYVTLGQNPDSGNAYMGLQFLPLCRPENYNGCSGILAKGSGWIYGLVAWLFITNLLVGLINLLPLGIVDGGRMFYLAMLTLTKSPKSARKIFGAVSIILLIMLLFFLLPALFNYFVAPFIS